MSILIRRSLISLEVPDPFRFLFIVELDKLSKIYEAIFRETVLHLGVGLISNLSQTATFLLRFSLPFWNCFYTDGANGPLNPPARKTIRVFKNVLHRKIFEFESRYIFQERTPEDRDKDVTFVVFDPDVKKIEVNEIFKQRPNNYLITIYSVYPYFQSEGSRSTSDQKIVRIERRPSAELAHYMG